MDWMSWKTWSVVGLIIVAAFAIYTFAATQNARFEDPFATSQTTSGTRATPPQAPLPGVTPVHKEWLDPQSCSYNSERHLFGYKGPSPPPPPSPTPPPPHRHR